MSSHPNALPTIILLDLHLTKLLRQRLGFAEEEGIVTFRKAGPELLNSLFPDTFERIVIGDYDVKGVSGTAFVLVFPNDEDLVEFKLRWLS